MRTSIMEEMKIRQTVTYVLTIKRKNGETQIRKCID